MSVALFTAVAGGVAGAQFEGDHTAITPQQCIEGGGVVRGAICEGGYYTGWITF
ncbi:hypothetical protein [Nocardia sp. NPDC048505]|uniref:hypothetical protein n=1 Tax=unclassified Nocardia TaxID=2637762 RepID=UPI0033FF22A4